MDSYDYIYNDSYMELVSLQSYLNIQIVVLNVINFNDTIS